MKMQLTLVLGAMVLAAAPAFATRCPADMAKIDAALAKKPQLSKEQLTQVRKLRADGEALHKAGKHQESVDTMSKALKILKIE